MSEAVNSISRKIRVTTHTVGEITPDELEARKNAIPPATSTKLNLDNIAKAFEAAGQTMQVKPAISAAQIIKAQNVAVEQVELEEVEEKSAKSFQPRVEHAVEDLGEHSERVALLSNGIFYDFQDVTARPFNLPEFVLLTKANRLKSNAMIVDVVSGALSVDARDLTEKDFRYMMYHLRIVSYVRNPYKLVWTSIYGNRNTITINKTTLKTVELDASKEEYTAWVARGFVMPTMRDLEEFDNLKGSLTPEDEFLWSRAKYVKGRNYKEKIANALKMSPDEFFVDTKQFIEKFEEYGVIEQTETTDQHFDLKKALETLSGYYKIAEVMLESSKTESDKIDWSKKLLSYQTEITRLSNLGEAAPISETVEFSIDITDFFSFV